MSYIFEKKYDEETYLSTLGTDMVNFLRQDYANRWKIYDDEALEMFDEPKKEDYPDPGVLRYLDFNLWSNDVTSHFEFISEVKEILTIYLDKRKENQKEKQSLKASGWGDYLKHISWIDNEPYIYKINHQFEVTTEQINKILDWAEKTTLVMILFFNYSLTGRWNILIEH